MTVEITCAYFPAGEDCTFRVRRLDTGVRIVWGVDLIDAIDGHQLPLAIKLFHEERTAMYWANEQATLSRRALETLTITVEA
jgi:hypothetical protein